MSWDEKWKTEAEEREKGFAQRVADAVNRAKDVVDARKCTCGDVTVPGASSCGQH